MITTCRFQEMLVVFGITSPNSCHPKPTHEAVMRPENCSNPCRHWPSLPKRPKSISKEWSAQPHSLKRLGLTTSGPSMAMTSQGLSPHCTICRTFLGHNSSMWSHKKAAVLCPPKMIPSNITQSANSKPNQTPKQHRNQPTRIFLASGYVTWPNRIHDWLASRLPCAKALI